MARGWRERTVVRLKGRTNIDEMKREKQEEERKAERREKVTQSSRRWKRPRGNTSRGTRPTGEKSAPEVNLKVGRQPGQGIRHP